MRKLARVRDRRSLLVLSTREVQRWALLRENFPDLLFLFLVLSLSLSRWGFLLFLHVLYFSHPQFVYARLSILVFLLALPPFPTFSSILPRLSQFFFSFPSTCSSSSSSSSSLSHQLWAAILLSCNRPERWPKRRRRRRKRKAVAVVTIIHVRIYPDLFFFWVEHKKKKGKRKTNSCNYDKSRKNIAYWFVWWTIQTSSPLALDIAIEQVRKHCLCTRSPLFSKRWRCEQHRRVF